jgi:hypothetical protein
LRLLTASSLVPMSFLDSPRTARLERRVDEWLEDDPGRDDAAGSAPQRELIA